MAFEKYKPQGLFSEFYGILVGWKMARKFHSIIIIEKG